VCADFLTMINSFVEKESKKFQRWLLTKGGEEKVGELLQRDMTLSEGKDQLNEMGLVYLVALQEGFIKDCLFALLVTRRELLRSDESITFRELASFESLGSMIASIAQRKVDELTGIEKVADFFEKRLGLSLEKDFDSWPLLAEAYYRRNVIVHNRGRSNETYCKKTGFKQRGKDLCTDIRYIQRVVKVTVDFIEFVHSSLSARFGASKLTLGAEWSSKILLDQ